MSTQTKPPEGRTTPSQKTLLDLLIINASDMIDMEGRIQVFRRIQHLADNTTRAAGRRGLWILIITRAREENPLIRDITCSLTSWCQGVRAVKSDPEGIERTALAFHQLHFPDVDERERLSRIVILGSAREVELSHIEEASP